MQGEEKMEKIKISKIMLVIGITFIIFSFSLAFAATEYRVNKTIAKNQINPDIATTDGNTYLSVWQDYSLNNTNVYMRLLDADGKPIGAEVNLTASYTNCDSYNPAVASNGNNYLVVWAQTSPEKCVRGILVNASGKIIGSDFIIEDYVFFGNPEEVDVASSGTNYLVIYNVAYHYKDIFGKTVSDTGSLGSLIQITNPNSGYAEDIAVSSNTYTYMVAWQNTVSGYVSIVGRWLDLTGNILTPQTTITPLDYYYEDIEVSSTALVGSYYYYVVWQKKDFSLGNSIIEGRCIDQSGGEVYFHTNVAPVSTNNGSEAEQNPAIAADKNHYLYVTWDGSDGSGFGIFGQKIKLDGSKVGGEFKVNNLTGRDQMNSQIASYPANKKALVVWQSKWLLINGFDIKSKSISRLIIYPALLPVIGDSAVISQEKK
jgi:hypothetical protein